MKKFFHKHQKDQKHRQIGGHLRALNVNTVKRLLSLRAEAKGISAKTTRVLPKHSDFAGSSTKIFLI